MSTTSALKRCVELDPLFQKGLDALFLVGSAAGATDLEMIALLHAQMNRLLAQLEPPEQQAAMRLGMSYFDCCHGEHEVA